MAMNDNQMEGIRGTFEVMSRKIAELTARVAELEKALSEHAHYARNGQVYERTSTPFAQNQYWDEQSGKVKTLP
jgi:hypothetical protein